MAAVEAECNASPKLKTCTKKEADGTASSKQKRDVKKKTFSDASAKQKVDMKNGAYNKAPAKEGEDMEILAEGNDVSQGTEVFIHNKAGVNQLSINDFIFPNSIARLCGRIICQQV